MSRLTAVNDQQQLERFHPVLLYNILSAVRRFEPDFYAHICRTYHIDADTIIGLFSEVEQLGPGQLQPILRDLRAHTAYHDIMYLAGRNTLLKWVELERLRPPRLGSASHHFGNLLKQLLPPFLGKATYVMMLRGNVHFLELRNSVFARDVQHGRPLCGFYCGYLAELAVHCGVESRPGVSEARCCAVEPDSPTCLFQVAF